MLDFIKLGLDIKHKTETYSVSQKRITDIFSRNSTCSMHSWILIIAVSHVLQKVGN